MTAPGPRCERAAGEGPGNMSTAERDVGHGESRTTKDMSARFGRCEKYRRTAQVDTGKLRNLTFKMRNAHFATSTAAAFSLGQLDRRN